MKKYLYVKDLDIDICKNLFGYNRYGYNEKISELSDFSMSDKLQYFFRTGKVIDDEPGSNKYSFYIDISNADFNDEDSNFLSNISNIAIEKRFEKTNYYKVDLYKHIPMNGLKRAIYCCINFAKKYPNTKIKLMSKYNSDMCLVFDYDDYYNEMKLEIIVSLTMESNTKPSNSVMFAYKHGKDDIVKFEKEVFSYYGNINK